MRKFSLLPVFVLFFSTMQAQEGDDDVKINNLSLGGGFGALTFYGEVTNSKNTSPLSGSFVGYHVQVQQRFLNCLGFDLRFLNGKVSGNERSSKRNLNFESPIMDVSGSLNFHFDNGFILSKSSVVSPYLGIGIGYLKFHPYGDLKDKNGNIYYYWSDGNIRDKSEDAPDAGLAVRISRDYKYETDLNALASADTMQYSGAYSKNSDRVKYDLHSLTFPITAGIKFRLSSSIHIDLETTYYLTQTDWIDNVSSVGKGVRKGDAQNDRFLYTNLSVHYNFGTSPKSSGTDLSGIEQADSDGDGVKDVKDECPGTPKGAKVDAKGCPKDSDGDGVPDYADKEPNSPKDAIVDANGVQLNDEALAVEQEAAVRVTPGTENESPVIRESNNSSVGSGLPAQYQSVDKNKDGKISADEINKAIDEFFDGNSKLTVNDIYRLIDYFFEQ